MPYPMFDRNKLKLKPLAERKHDMTLGEVLSLDAPGEPFDDPQLAQVYLLTKLLIALLLTETQWQLALAAPASFHNPERPLSLWRFTQLALEAFRQSVCGSLTWNKIALHLPELDRYLCNEPRRRRIQLAALRNLGMICGF